MQTLVEGPLIEYYSPAATIEYVKQKVVRQAQANLIVMAQFRVQPVMAGVSHRFVLYKFRFFYRLLTKQLVGSQNFMGRQFTNLQVQFAMAHV